MNKPEIWGGIECSMNRVGDNYFGQLARNGHLFRPDDLELFAGLGLKKLRYPLLWEQLAPEDPNQINWAWAEANMHRLKELKIDPIVGLIHHGSGPKYTNLLDENFPEKLAAYARKVAEKFPWVTYYTPVNEPLTTARFSGLYGLWFPHERSDNACLKMLLNQLKGTVLAMREISNINPAARLVQTEDLGLTHSTESLAYQAEFENSRRWLTFDLLCGKVNQEHPLWGYFQWAGIDEKTVLFFAENPLPPDLIGINHYITSERFLDENLVPYPPHTHGQNHRHRYADVEAVRIENLETAGPEKLLLDTWNRYNLPLAVTEVHLNCTREEQMRWLQEVWQAAGNAQKQGAEIKAVTAWSLLGSFDWNSLLTQPNDHYETGIFDICSEKPRATALAKQIKAYAGTGKYAHEILKTPGWWHRPGRFNYHCFESQNAMVSGQKSQGNRAEKIRPILITGATGTLGNAFARICEKRGLTYVLLSRNGMDIAEKSSVENAVQKYQPWAIINTAGYVRVDEAETDADRCYRENTDGPKVLAEVCAQENIQLLTFSSDLVFGGTKNTPYLETDQPNPTNVYGSSKHLAEKHVLEILPEALIIRTSAFFGPWDSYNFLFHALETLSRNEVFTAASDAFISPTYVPDLVHTALDLLLDKEKGIWHVANQGEITWADFARKAADMLQIQTETLEQKPVNEFNFTAQRPAYTVLSSARGNLLPSLEDALARFVRDSEHRVWETVWFDSQKVNAETASEY
ncbi:sugar nucleotide-binding protein [Adhaeribacter sp. BT258]|uniref:dTDP-4-dehydrorhamnose reductase n=1 Tax=Adhaeribacter terrigena TaxID=2793070 RepID=A0ABS1BWK9_9BACT|nr:family 1 glycosylhydrolase [Adhaeribacter terrigena]MBK0401447.1 sugar nucleotide-binding protein [Adhaeribacter terrigena]